MGEVRRRSQADQLALSRIRTFPGAAAGEGLAVRVGRQGDLIRQIAGRTVARSYRGTRSIDFDESVSLDAPASAASFDLDMPDDGVWFFAGTVSVNWVFPGDETDPGSGIWSVSAAEDTVGASVVASGFGTWAHTGTGTASQGGPATIPINGITRTGFLRVGATISSFVDAGYPNPDLNYVLALRAERLHD